MLLTLVYLYTYPVSNMPIYVLHNVTRSLSFFLYHLVPHAHIMQESTALGH